MVSSATTQEENKESECLCQNAPHTNLMYLTGGLEECQPTRQDYEHALIVIGAYTEAIQDDPINTVAYRDRALAFAFLGREQESRQDSSLAAYAGFDRQQLREEVNLVQEIAIGYQDWDDGRTFGPTTAPGAGLVSILLSLIHSILGR